MVCPLASDFGCQMREELFVGWLTRSCELSPGSTRPELAKADSGETSSCNKKSPPSKEDLTGIPSAL